MNKNKWYEKFVGCCFSINLEEYIFNGTYSNTENKNGLPLQYVFVNSDTNTQYITDYKEARQVMGTMIEKYSK